MTDPSMISSGLVRGAYASSRSLQGGESNAARDAASGFAEMVQDAAQSAVEKVRSGEEVAAAEKRLGRPLTILVGKPGLDGHSNGAEQIAVRARDAGFEVVYEGIRLTPSQIGKQAARQEWGGTASQSQ